VIRPGLVSISFRQLSPQEIVALCVESQLEGIEWGGDVHVPHGNLETASEVAKLTRDAGLEVAAYGSYYRAGTRDHDLPFSKVLDSAIALGAPLIRVWAGNRGSADAGPGLRADVAKDLTACGTKAGEAGLAVALEFHGGTLTDTAESAADLMQELEGSGVRLYWQPPVGLPPESAAQGLRHVLPWVDNVHVFAWRKDNDGIAKLPLFEGAESWALYLNALRTADQDRWALLEFVRDNDPGNLPADAATLRSWLA
jgi:3-dehydroshikimate dehydratase